ncbi:MAG: hypothetical protein IJ659_04875 [Alloprevotella sp.]|nr:hypothetical protein [Alloprevotella sp.]
MKKTYSFPQTDIVNIATQGILALSKDLNFKNDGTGTGSTSNTGAVSAGMTRGQNGGFGSGLWEDMK